jgi:sulfopyruvate decarboxylase subunit alpha
MSDPRSAAVIAAVEALGPRWILHLPSSTLKTVVGHFLAKDGQDGFRIVPIPREEEGVGILAGLALAGTPALMIIQDNGIGNMLTALNTFPIPYHIPLLVIVTRRGGLSEYNSHFCSHFCSQCCAPLPLDGRRRVPARAA